jgi:hypothetical protein
MNMDDAVYIAHELHLLMKFAPVKGGVMPYPMPNDVAEVCQNQVQDPILQKACSLYGPRETEEAFFVPAAEAAAMAAALNQLYGIP